MLHKIVQPNHSHVVIVMDGFAHLAVQPWRQSVLGLQAVEEHEFLADVGVSLVH